MACSMFAETKRITTGGALSLVVKDGHMRYEYKTPNILLTPLQEVLPYFLKSEDNSVLEVSPYHNKGGPLHVSKVVGIDVVARILF